jgi:predicted RND superfamily exporter protein
MAGLLAANTTLGVASSFISFSDVAWRVLKRIREYNDRTGDDLAIVQIISARLPGLIDKMEELKLETETGSEAINSQNSLAVAVTSCNELIQRLDVLTKKLIPDEIETKQKRLKKAISSVYYKKELSKTWGEIENYKALLFTKVKEIVQEHEIPHSDNPVFMVPFEKDPKFVGRADVIADIEEALKIQSRIAIAGIGGVG